MSLYQKYRPNTFEDVIAQVEVVTYLHSLVKKSENNETIPHAYIFSGTHGIGKTTLARIFARELGTKEEDVYELDAASTSRKIDDMRDLIERVYTLPMSSKYKVYILDEAHSLTKDSSNAFLKTLEEPPAHAIFILCTTDEDKILRTVRSRCNVIKLSSPSASDIVDNLNIIIKSEKLKISSEVLEVIASSSNRSFRDSITNLEKFINTYTERTLSEAYEMFGSSDVSMYAELDKILEKKLTPSALQAPSPGEGQGASIADLIKFISKNYNHFSYDNYIKHIRENIILNNGEEDSDKKIHQVYSFKNLLYLLEKENIYNDTNDKFSALLAIFGEMR